MSPDLTTVFLWNESYQEKTLVAASASSETVEVYYALESKCARNGSSCTVSSHVWYREERQYYVDEVAVSD